MLDYFKNKQENPIAEVFNDLTENQKMSVMNLFITIVISEGEQAIKDKEMNYINTYISILSTRSDKCMAYMTTEGAQRMISDLKKLSKSQLEFLVGVTFEIITCEGRPSNTKITVTAELFEQLGFKEHEYIATIDKMRALKKQFLG
jgi:hypothetical protein